MPLTGPEAACVGERPACAAAAVLDEIPLVGDQDECAALVESRLAMVRSWVLERCGGIEDQGHDVGEADRSARSPRSKAARWRHRPRLAAEARRYRQLDRAAGRRTRRLHTVPGEAGLGAGQHPLALEQAVDQRGLADVGPADDRRASADRARPPRPPRRSRSACSWSAWAPGSSGGAGPPGDPAGRRHARRRRRSGRPGRASRPRPARPGRPGPRPCWRAGGSAWCSGAAGRRPRGRPASPRRGRRSGKDPDRPPRGRPGSGGAIGRSSVVSGPGSMPAVSIRRNRDRPTARRPRYGRG